MKKDPYNRAVLAFLIGFNLEFVRELLYAFRESIGTIPGDGGIQMLSALLMIYGSLLTVKIKKTWKNIPKFWRRWAIATVLWITIIFVRSLLILRPSNAVGVYLLIFPWLGYASVLLIFFGGIPELWNKVQKSIVIHSLVGIVLMVWAIANVATLSRPYVMTRLEGATAFRFLYGYPVLLASWGIQTTLGKITGIISLFVFIIGGIYRDDRGVVLRVIIFVLFIVYVKIRVAKEEKEKKNDFTPMIFSSITILFWILMIFYFGKQSYLFGHWTKLGGRFSGQENLSTDTRFEEVSLLWSQMSFQEKLIGRGFNMPWDGRAIYNEFRYGGVHVAYVDFIYHGGYILFIFMVTPILLGIYVFFRKRELIKLSASILLAQSLFGHFELSNVGITPGFALYCICIGVCCSKKSFAIATTGSNNKKYTRNRMIQQSENIVVR